MTYEHIAIGALLAAHLSTLYILYHVRKDRDSWEAAWLRDSKELLYWKRNGLLRDPETGKYIKKGSKP